MHNLAAFPYDKHRTHTATEEWMERTKIRTFSVVGHCDIFICNDYSFHMQILVSNPYFTNFTGKTSFGSI